MQRYVCIHGHFYQPPRENPWIEEVELQDSAYPYHDWNERITAECYSPNTASRILDHEGAILDIVNNYSRISFNFGPTLLSWMERHVPHTLEAIVEADRLSQERFSGHGSAMAQIYNHMIMPLANERDKKTQVVWALEDFRAHFNRDPEGVWLPETAVDTDTLEILAEHGIRFTVLAPRQASRVRFHDQHGDDFMDVSGNRVDPTCSYRCQLPSGRTIALFFYDGPISQALAFESLLASGEAFAGRIAAAFNDDRPWPQLAHIATDGESYGHHHAMGDMGLAYCLHHIEAAGIADLTVYGEYLEKHPPVADVEIFDNSSWSCIHGIDRWRADCGCNSGHPTWRQAWRGPLRTSLDQLRDAITPLFESEGTTIFTDPWEARDAYIQVLLARHAPEAVDAFLAATTTRELTGEDRVLALQLMEIQRHAMFMYTSCGWFFDEISGLETTQIMAYAARVIQLASRIFSIDLEQRFLKTLAQAPSNIPEFGHGAKVYEKFIKPMVLDLHRVAAHFAIASLFHETLEEIEIYCYRAETEFFEKHAAGQLAVSMGKTVIRSMLTQEARPIYYTAVHFGGHAVSCGVGVEGDDATFLQAGKEYVEALRVADLPKLVQLLDQQFDHDLFSVMHLFRDEQQHVFDNVLQQSLDEIWSTQRRLLDQNITSINFLKEAGRPIPPVMRTMAEGVYNQDLRALFQEEELYLDELRALADNCLRLQLTIDAKGLARHAEKHVTNLMEQLAEGTLEDLALLPKLKEVLDALHELRLPMNLWRVQNLYHTMSNGKLLEMQALAGNGKDGNEDAAAWVEHFRQLAGSLFIKGR